MVDGIIVADNQGKIILVNESVEKMFGYPRDELLKMHTAELAIEDGGQVTGKHIMEFAPLAKGDMRIDDGEKHSNRR